MRALPGFVACGLAATASLAAPAPADAQAAASAHLVYVRGPGAEGCPGEHAIRSAVGTRLGYDPFFPWARDTLFTEITRSDGEFHVDLKLVDDRNLLRGARQISVTATDCAAAIDAIGLTISLTIDPASLLRPASTPPVAAPTPEVQPELPLPDPPMARDVGSPSPRSRSERIHGRIGVGAVGSFGAAPAATLGPTLSAGASWRSLSLDVEGRADLPATGAAQETSARVRSWLVVGSLVPCLHLGGPFGCFVFSGGSLGATSVGTSAPHTDHAPWWAAGLRAGGEIALQGPLSLRAYAELLATLTRDSLGIDGVVAYRLAPWSGGLGAELAWRFP
jgi:hypothetical protein